MDQMHKRPTWFTWEKVPINKHIWKKLWLYHNMDYKKKIIIFFLRNEWSFICKNLCTLHTRMLCVKFSWKCLKKKIFKCRQCIFAFSLLSPLRKGRGPSFEQIWIPFTRECFVLILVKISPEVLEKKILIWKVHNWTKRWMVGRQTICDNKNLFEFPAQVS